MPPDPIAAYQSLSNTTGEVSVVFTSPAFLAVKYIFIVFSLLFLFHTIYLLYKTGRLGAKVKLYGEALWKKEPPMHKDEFLKTWDTIRSRMEMRREADWKLAVIEADKMLDDLLKRSGYQGKDMGERLKQLTREQLSNIDDIWKAHKARNRLSHEVNYHLPLTEARWMIEAYEDAFREMQLLD